MLRKYRIEILVFLLIVTGFFVFALLHPPVQPNDINEYIRAARLISNDAALFPQILEALEDELLFSKTGPVYPLILVVAGSLTDSFWPIFILQLLLSFGSFLLMLNIFKPEPNMQVLLLALVLIFPAQILFSNLLLPDIMFQFVIMLSAALLMSYIHTGRIRILWFYQASVFFAILIHPIFYYFVLPNLILFIFLYFKSKQRLVFISSLIPIVLLIIVAGINQQQTGYFHISTKRQAILTDEHLYYYIQEKAGKEQAEKTISEIYMNCDRIPDVSRRMACLKESTHTLISEDKISYLLFRSKETLLALIDPGNEFLKRFIERDISITGKINAFAYEKNPISSLDRLFSLPFYWILIVSVLLLLNVARIAGFLLYLFNRNFRIESRLFFLFMVITILILGPSPGTAQNVLPVFFLLSGGAILQYGRWIKRYRERKQPADELNPE